MMDAKTAGLDFDLAELCAALETMLDYSAAGSLNARDGEDEAFDKALAVLNRVKARL